MIKLRGRHRKVVLLFMEALFWGILRGCPAGLITPFLFTFVKTHLYSCEQQNPFSFLALEKKTDFIRKEKNAGGRFGAPPVPPTTQRALKSAPWNPRLCLRAKVLVFRREGVQGAWRGRPLFVGEIQGANRNALWSLFLSGFTPFLFDESKKKWGKLLCSQILQ